MKTTLVALLSLWSVGAYGQTLVVVAKVEELPVGHYQILKEPGCNEPTDSGELILCNAGWTRYRLSHVMTLEGRRLADTVALIYTDPHLGGAKLMQLETLKADDSKRFGASYKVISMGTAFSGACVDEDIPVTDESKVRGPVTIKGFGEKCYLMPLWWLR